MEFKELYSLFEKSIIHTKVTPNSGAFGPIPVPASWPYEFP
jgi:hypothetical protein